MVRIVLILPLTLTVLVVFKPFSSATKPEPALQKTTLESRLTPTTPTPTATPTSSSTPTSTSTPTAPTTTTPTTPEDASERFLDLEKQEAEIDKEMDEEIAERKNATAKKTTAKFSKEAGKQCNDGLQVDLDRPGTLALCQCGIDEVVVNGSCTSYEPGTTIDVEKYIFHMQETPVSNFKIRVQDLDCNNENTHQNMTFERGSFFLRNRGDVVLTSKAEHISGLRISDYCINHYLDSEGKLTWKMKACVPHPSIPRCCPPNQILRNGTCHTGPSPEHFVPPIHADPRGLGAVTWPVIGNHINSLTCDESESLKTVALEMRGSFLLALPNGLAYRWFPSNPEMRPKFMFCPNFCVDGRQSVDGSIEYLANFCHASSPKQPKETCKTKSCIQKCCKKGEIMSFDHYRCVKVKDDLFKPPVMGNISEYEVIVGRPECGIHLPDLNTVIIDKEGSLRHDKYTIPRKDYCIDTFAKQGEKSMQALICPGGRAHSLWWVVRPILFPVCQVISLIFLGITVGCYILAPVLLKQGGWHRLCYVLSLMLAYATTFSVHVNHPWGKACIAVGIIIQFAFLSTFFWLCIMCFDIESKIRSLRHFRAHVAYHPMVYAAFGFGGPIIISTATLILQTAVPYGTPGIIKPSIGISSCWFYSDHELLIYFYGPIATLFIFNILLIISTAWNYRKIEKGALGMMMKSQTENGPKTQQPLEYERQKQTTKNFAEFKHKFLLMSLMCFCWITEILSWKIPPPELWAFTDILNTLQGFFIFVIFIVNRRNRKTLKKLHPRLFSVFRPVKNLFRKLRNLFWKKSSTSSNSQSVESGRSQEPSISSEFSDLSDN